MTEQEKKLRTLPFATHATRGIIRDPGTRRKVMLGVVLAAVVMLIGGATILKEALDPREHAMRFIIFWAVCAWLTVTALLLALFDVLILRAQSRAARRALRGEVASKVESSAAE